MEPRYKRLEWISRTNIYEVNLRQYTPEGTFKAFLTHLPRLKDMGVEVLWFMPITPISVRNRKGSLGSFYASSDFLCCNPEFGTTAEFCQLVNAVHALGMKAIIDWVSNHTGCDHVWTTRFPSFYKRNAQGEFYDAHGWDDVIDLDYSNTDMRREMISSMHFWVEQCGIDGFRCDMAMLTPVDFWQEARSALEKEKTLFWFAELDPLDHAPYMEVFDSAYTWRWMHGTKHFKDEGARQIHHLRQILDQYTRLSPLLHDPAWFTSNHDENSWNGTEYEKYGEMAIPLAVFSSMWRGMPLLYSGQEIPNKKRLAFFDKDQLDWKSEPLLHDFYKKLFRLRRECNAFHHSVQAENCFVVWNSVDHHVLSFVRKHMEAQVLVLINFSQHPLHLTEVDTHLLQGTFKELFSAAVQQFQGNQYFHLQPWGYQVWVNQ